MRKRHIIIFNNYTRITFLDFLFFVKIYFVKCIRSTRIFYIYIYYFKNTSFVVHVNIMHVISYTYTHTHIYLCPGCTKYHTYFLSNLLFNTPKIFDINLIKRSVDFSSESLLSSSSSSILPSNANNNL